MGPDTLQYIAIDGATDDEPLIIRRPCMRDPRWVTYNIAWNVEDRRIVICRVPVKMEAE
jgi:hypothetical protein